MTTRAKSLISLKAHRSSELVKSANSFKEDFENVDFAHFVSIACKKFECPILVTVARKILQRHHVSRLKSMDIAKLRMELKYKRKSTPTPVHVLEDPPNSSLEFDLRPDQKLLVTAVYDGLNELAEILMFKSHVLIPRVLMQVIALKVPHYVRTLTKFTIKQCIIDMNTIYELYKILTMSNITDICLDHSPLKEGNYDLLLSDSSCLRSLSLSRCNINDVICERIASRLHRLEPAEETLLTLNLSSNLITDVGVKHFGEALRSNRHLRYLNIADNQIGDDGAKYIFEVLTEFPLNNDEIQDKNQCYMEYLREKEALYNRYMLNIANHKKSGKKCASGKGKHKLKVSKSGHTMSEHLSLKARSIAEEVLGPFEHPFSPATVTVNKGKSCCLGNFTLCYLNLRYNNLTYQSVQRLAAVVRHQKIYRSEKLCGLLIVLLEGNYVPEISDEIIKLNNYVNTSKLNVAEADKIIPPRARLVKTRSAGRSVARRSPSPPAAVI